MANPVVRYKTEVQKTEIFRRNPHSVRSPEVLKLCGKHETNLNIIINRDISRILNSAAVQKKLTEKGIKPKKDAFFKVELLNGGKIRVIQAKETRDGKFKEIGEEVIVNENDVNKGISQKILDKASDIYNKCVKEHADKHAHKTHRKPSLSGRAQEHRIDRSKKNSGQSKIAKKCRKKKFHARPSHDQHRSRRRIREQAPNLLPQSAVQALPIEYDQMLQQEHQQVVQLQQQIGALQKTHQLENQRAQAEISAMGEAIQTLTNRKAELDANLREKTAEAGTLQSQLTLARSQLDKAYQNEQEQAKTLSDKEVELGRARGLIDRLSKEIAAKEHANEILRDQLRSLTDEIATLNAEHTSLHDQISSNEDEIRTKEQGIAILTTENQIFAEQLASKNNENIVKTLDLAFANANLAQAEKDSQERNALRADITKLRSENVALAANQGRIQERLEKLKQQKALAVTQIKKDQLEIRRLNAQNQTLAAQIQQAQAEKGQAEHLLKQANAEKDQLNKQILEHQAEEYELSAEITALRDNFNAAVQENEAAKQNLAQADQQLAQMQRDHIHEIDTKNVQISDLQAQAALKDKVNAEQMGALRADKEKAENRAQELQVALDQLKHQDQQEAEKQKVLIKQLQTELAKVQEQTRAEIDALKKQQADLMQSNNADKDKLSLALKQRQETLEQLVNQIAQQRADIDQQQKAFDFELLLKDNRNDSLKADNEVLKRTLTALEGVLDTNHNEIQGLNRIISNLHERLALRDRVFEENQRMRQELADLQAKMKSQGTEYITILDPLKQENRDLHAANENLQRQSDQDKQELDRFRAEDAARAKAVQELNARLDAQNQELLAKENIIQQNMRLLDGQGSAIKQQLNDSAPLFDLMRKNREGQQNAMQQQTQQLIRERDALQQQRDAAQRELDKIKADDAARAQAMHANFDKHNQEFDALQQGVQRNLDELLSSKSDRNQNDTELELLRRNTNRGQTAVQQQMQQLVKEKDALSKQKDKAERELASTQESLDKLLKEKADLHRKQAEVSDQIDAAYKKFGLHHPSGKSETRELPLKDKIAAIEKYLQEHTDKNIDELVNFAKTHDIEMTKLEDQLKDKNDQLEDGKAILRKLLDENAKKDEELTALKAANAQLHTENDTLKKQLKDADKLAQKMIGDLQRKNASLEEQYNDINDLMQPLSEKLQETQ